MAKCRKFNPDCSDCVREKKARDRLLEKADRASIKVVSIVNRKVIGGTLYAWDGVEAARQVRELLGKTFT